MDVAFIYCDEEALDFIVSFAVDVGDGEIESLILSRIPKFELLLPEEERGVSVSFEDDGSELMPPRITACRIDNERAEIVSSRQTYRLDLRRIESADLLEAFAVLRKMNFDACSTLDIGASK